MIVHVKPENNSISAHVPSGDPVHISVHARVTPGTDITVEPLSVTTNGTYTAPSGTAYSPITVTVPTPTPIDVEPLSVTTNGTYTAPSGTAYSPVTVVVPQPEPIDVEQLSVTANGTYTAPSGKAYSPVTVNVEASDSVPAKDVNFYDYDGTRVYAYTAAEFANLSAMPANPSHTGLTAQGWNWTLADAKTYVAAYGMLEIGQSYASSSGNTEIDIELDGADLSPVLMIELDGAANVFWGDGAVTNATGASIGNSETVFLPHTYSSPGSYTISIVLTSGSELGFVHSTDSKYAGILSDKSAKTTSAKYSSRVVAIRPGTGLSYIGGYAFSKCTSLLSLPLPNSFTSLINKSFGFSYLRHITVPSGNTAYPESRSCFSLISVSLPKSATGISSSAFYNCPNLKRVSIPEGVTSLANSFMQGCGAAERVSVPSSVTSIGSSAFSGNFALKALTIPAGVSSIANLVFYNCNTLEELTIPGGVTSIGSQGLSYCSSLKALHVQATTPPTLDANSLSYTPASCKIYVPSASVNAYKTATNWSTYANQIFGE